ncbi:MAG: nucleotidyltransferase family protein, partial [Firmicutes bacterium]|nr:nucleotidyltransferase family protein [Bacillota bacterium]
MRIVFIIAEFDPFHMGHAFLLGRVRERFPQCAVAAIMSGNFTERGEPASIERFTRARAAVLSGVNLVISLPFPWCASSSEYFARAGVA